MEYEAVLREKLTEKRYVHSIEVSKAAVRLAERYGADVEKARLAGLLHDVMKDAGGEAQLQIIENSGTILTNVERSSQKLWHGIAGAIFVRDVLKIGDPDIFDAIRYHTTGRAGMSLLEQVVFVADYTSDDREYEDARTVREIAKESLRKAIVAGIAFTVTDLISRGRTVAPDTIDAYNESLLFLQGQAEKEKRE